MTTYTNINKPTGTSYTNQNSIGKEQYDQNTILYDDSGVFYDGINQSLYTNVLKPLMIGLWNAQTLPWQELLPWQFGSSTIYTNIAKPL